MDFIYEKVAYLRGLTDGLDINETTAEGKLLLKIVDTLEVFADAIVDLDEEVEELTEYIEIVDEDLADLEEFVRSIDEDFGEDFDEFECPTCGTILYVDEDDFDEEGNVELACPECGGEYVVTDDFDCHCHCEDDDSDDHCNEDNCCSE